MAYTIPSAMPWPSALLCRERSLQWIPDYGHEASPPALDGTRQFGSSNGGGLWRAMLNGVQLRTPEHVKAWLAFEIQLRGGMTPIDVPLFLGHQPRPDSGTSVNIRADHDGTTYGWRLHRIETVAFSSGDLADITFWPPARFAVANNHRLEFDDPKCVMRLAGSGSTDLTLEYRKRGDPDASFVEAGG
jgi:hypothetical protein